MLKTASAIIALLALANPALAAGCATPNEAAALRTAVIQQELMVAALQCHEAAAYNRFVMNYRGELQTSDATLKAFFIRSFTRSFGYLKRLNSFSSSKSNRIDPCWRITPFCLV